MSPRSLARFTKTLIAIERFSTRNKSVHPSLGNEEIHIFIEKESGAYMIYYISKTLGPTWCSQRGGGQGVEGRRTSLSLGAHRAPWWQNCFHLLFKTFSLTNAFQLNLTNCWDDKQIKWKGHFLPSLNVQLHHNRRWELVLTGGVQVKPDIQNSIFNIQLQIHFFAFLPFSNLLVATILLMNSAILIWRTCLKDWNISHWN